MKKTIWIPIVIGLVAGILNYATMAVNFTVTLANDLVLAPSEIFNLFAGALGGPIAMVINELLWDISAYQFVFGPAYPWPIYMTIANSIAHIISMLVAIFAYRLIYQRMKMPLRLAAWILLVGIYYFLLLLPLQVSLFKIAMPALTYQDYISTFYPEFIATAIVTSLIWIALSEPFRKPLWYESK